MATTIKLKNSVTTTAAPSSLSQGEAAVNITDKKVWVGNAASSPVQILGAGATVSGTDATFTGNVTLGDASGDALTINSSAVSIPNGLNFDSNTFVIDATNNRVGVGTASPSYAFHVNGNGYATNQLIADTGEYKWGAGSTSIYGTSASNYIALITNSSERMRIDSSGNVGIGTSSPSVKLDVVGAVKASSYIQFGAGATTSAIYTYGANTGGGIAQWVDNSAGNGTGWTGASGAYNSYIGTVTNTSLGFATNSTVRATLDSSGNLGLGVTPSAWGSGYKAFEFGSGGNSLWSTGSNDARIGTNFYFDGASSVYKTSSTAAQYRQAGGVHYWYTAPSGTAGNAITFTQAMTLDASGNLLVGTTSTLGGSQLKVGDGGTGNYTTGFTVLNGSNASGYGPLIRYYNNGTFMADAGDYSSIVGSGTHQYAIRCGASGGVYLAATATSWSAISDENQKNIIEPITDGLNKVASLRSVIGSYKTDEEGTRRAFLIAQDVQKVLPEAVSENEHDGETVLGVAYTDVIPLLVAAINELKAEVDSLKAQLNKE